MRYRTPESFSPELGKTIARRASRTALGNAAEIGKDKNASKAK